jgi:hypothetical protein
MVLFSELRWWCRVGQSVVVVGLPMVLNQEDLPRARSNPSMAVYEDFLVESLVGCG